MTEPKTVLDIVSDAAVIGAVTAAVIGAFALFYQIRSQMREKHQAAQGALFAELAHIASHYYNSAALLKFDGEEYPMRRRLKFSKYGQAIAATSLREYSMLGPQEMAEFLQLSFVSRNTDTMLDEFIDSMSSPPADQLEILRTRMIGLATGAERLLNYLQSRNPKFAPVHLDPYFGKEK